MRLFPLASLTSVLNHPSALFVPCAYGHIGPARAPLLLTVHDAARTGASGAPNQQEPRVGSGGRNGAPVPLPWEVLTNGEGPDPRIWAFWQPNCLTMYGLRS